MGSSEQASEEQAEGDTGTEEEEGEGASTSGVEVKLIAGAKKLANDYDITDFSSISATGADGKITKADVEEHLSGK